ncbi:hypothetical protein RGB72_01535 [Glutamicibacter protophormiae]|uniref:Uncharacterized protein n=2 Tax=Kocuria TaxID=57493 RepID=A0A7D7Q347_KOCVA|nr:MULTISPECIES: hypothetical protein [Kocuria]QMS55322.1 hypothetical protein CIB50_0000002 [Kocuria varians]WNB89158.1 hypothetical protein RGB72_01535 [Glutamicibacter protophormiae]
MGSDGDSSRTGTTPGAMSGRTADAAPDAASGVVPAPAPGRTSGAGPDAVPGRRRGSHRRATGGTVPDAERALGGSQWSGSPDDLGADAPDPREVQGEAGHEEWLRRQRPPHWG